MAKYVAFLELDDGTVIEMEVGAADSGAGDFEDYVAILEDFGLRAFDWRRSVSIFMKRRFRGTEEEGTDSSERHSCPSMREPSWFLRDLHTWRGLCQDWSCSVL